MLSSTEIRGILRPFETPAGNVAEGSAAALTEERAYQDLAIYLHLLLRWNAKTNLTAIRDPVEIVKRHFGESFFFGRRLQPGGSILDFGSGSGIPGIPLQILDRKREVVLAESQNKKASFLREVIRALDLRTEVWAKRVELLPKSRIFGDVVLRAVDRMQAALPVAVGRTENSLYLFSTVSEEVKLVELLGGRMHVADRWRIPESTERVLLRCC